MWVRVERVTLTEIVFYQKLKNLCVFRLITVWERPKYKYFEYLLVSIDVPLLLFHYYLEFKLGIISGHSHNHDNFVLVGKFPD